MLEVFTVVRSTRVVTGGKIQPAEIVFTAEKIVEIVPIGTHKTVLDWGDDVVLPGAVDVHVHINEPGRTHWEGFETATKAAAAGGTTTMVEMPLNAIPSTNHVPALKDKIAIANGKLHVDVGFWGGAVPDNIEDLEPLWNAGVLGFKSFMTPAGTDEFDHVTFDDLLEIAPVLARLNAPLLVHAEDPEVLDRFEPKWEKRDPVSYSTYLATRPPEAEVSAIASLIDICEQTGLRAHVVHVAAKEAITQIQHAKTNGVDITAETCAHYLFFCAEEIQDGATQMKCAPPIRERSHRDALRSAIGTTLDFVTTDHSPAPPEIKSLDTGRFDTAWGGIASIEVFLRAVYTVLLELYGPEQTLLHLATLTATEPAKFAGLKDRGEIAIGKRADFVRFNTDAQTVVDAANLQHRHPICAYDGKRLKGQVKETWLSGNSVYSGEGFSSPSGKVVLRKP